MARSHLTLAALATSAVPELDLVGAGPFGSGAGGSTDGSFDSALLTGRDGRHWLIRIPRKRTSRSRAVRRPRRPPSAQRRGAHPPALRRLAFAGQTPIDGTRAIVYEFVYGSKVALPDVAITQATSVGRAIAAIHALPTSFIADAGLPVLGPIECLRAVVTVMDRAAATGLVPPPLLARWEAATEESKLWQFQPTVINGSLTADSLLWAGDEVTGVLGWHELRVGDPARDLFWMLGARDDAVAEVGFDAYNESRGGADRQVRQRAALYAELELAKWLLHGTELRSTEIVDDAVDLLTMLSENVQGDLAGQLGAQTMPTLAVHEVEAMLARSERAV